ncbi:MAG: c-type cytochrome biogenesis protein CcmI [Sneathiella sp.]|nr:c-type cytochrome biogenesis protein CcmI [Sneathiella sp.]
MIWFVASLILLAALIVLGWPLFRSGGPAISRSERGLDVYRRQLGELDEEIARGALETREADSIQLEIKRRILRLGHQEKISSPVSGTRNWIVILAIIVIIPVASLGLYVDLGSPDEPSRPLPSRDIAAETAALQSENLAPLIKRLIDALREKPDNLDGWILLARTLTRMERYQEGAETYLKATVLAPEATDLYMGAGENYYFAADGTVTPDAEKAFEKALALSPKDPGARYYLALRDAQKGDEPGALKQWIALYEGSPADAPYMPVLTRRIKETAAKTGSDLGDLFEKKMAAIPRSGPNGEDIAAAANMSADDRQAMIGSMVQRLSDRMAETPDYDGLMRLGQVYGTLAQYDKSAEAYARASALRPDDKLALAAEAGAYIQGAGKDSLPSTAVDLYRKVLALDPDHPQALWYVGFAEAAAGNDSEAARLWTRLQQLTPDGSPVHDAAVRAIKDLSAKGKN